MYATLIWRPLPQHQAAVENKYRPMADTLEDVILANDPKTNWRDVFRRSNEEVAAAQEAMEYFPAQAAVGKWIKQGKL